MPRLTIQWPDAPFSASICRKCIKSDRQLLASLSEGIAVPDPERTFLLDVDLNVDCRGGPDCIHQNLPEVSRGARKRYFMGRFSDGEFLDAYRAEVEPRIHSVRGPLFVAGGVCYGSDPKAFLEALHPTPEERRALEGILSEVDHYFEIDQATGSQALEKLWHDHAEEIVAAIVPDEARAARLVKEARAAPGRVSDLLSRAARETREREVLQSLPRFEGLGREGLFADSVLRAYRSQGPRAAERQLIHALPPDGKERGLAFGFLVALQQEQPHVWQFTETERQFGTNLAPLAQRALAAPPDEVRRRAREPPLGGGRRVLERGRGRPARQSGGLAPLRGPADTPSLISGVGRTARAPKANNYLEALDHGVVDRRDPGQGTTGRTA